MPRHRLSNPRSVARGFTLVELMIVLTIIVVLVAAAVPALRSIMGTRSNEVAINKISAFLGRARLRAIGLQEPSGIFFYIDPQTQLITMSMVRQTPPEYNDKLTNAAYVDFVPNEGTETIPRGVGVQFFSNTNLTADSKGERYIGFNTNSPGGLLAYGSVILFDAYGRLATVPYAFRCVGLTNMPTEMGNLLYFSANPQAASADFIPPPNAPPANPAGLMTQIALVLYDAQSFSTNGYTLGDPQVDPSVTGGNETNEETWLDQTGLPLVINRYNGTVIKGE